MRAARDMNESTHLYYEFKDDGDKKKMNWLMGFVFVLLSTLALGIVVHSMKQESTAAVVLQESEVGTSLEEQNLVLEQEGRTEILKLTNAINRLLLRLPSTEPLPSAEKTETKKFEEESTIVPTGYFDDIIIPKIFRQNINTNGKEFLKELNYMAQNPQCGVKCTVVAHDSIKCCENGGTDLSGLLHCDPKCSDLVQESEKCFEEFCPSLSTLVPANADAILRETIASVVDQTVVTVHDPYAAAKCVNEQPRSAEMPVGNVGAVLNVAYKGAKLVGTVIVGINTCKVNCADYQYLVDNVGVDYRLCNLCDTFDFKSYFGRRMLNNIVETKILPEFQVNTWAMVETGEVLFQCPCGIAPFTDKNTEHDFRYPAQGKIEAQALTMDESVNRFIVELPKSDPVTAEELKSNPDFVSVSCKETGGIQQTFHSILDGDVKKIAESSKPWFLKKLVFSLQESSKCCRMGADLEQNTFKRLPEWKIQYRFEREA